MKKRLNRFVAGSIGILLFLCMAPARAQSSYERALGDLHELSRELIPALLKAYPPEQYCYVTVGQSPTFLEAELEQLGFPEIDNLPVSTLTTVWGEAERSSLYLENFEKTLQRFLPPSAKVGGRTLVFIDLLLSGKSLHQLDAALKRYAADPAHAISWKTFTFGADSSNFPLKPALLNQFVNHRFKWGISKYGSNSVASAKSIPEKVIRPQYRVLSHALREKIDQDPELRVIRQTYSLTPPPATTWKNIDPSVVPALSLSHLEPSQSEWLKESLRTHPHLRREVAALFGRDPRWSIERPEMVHAVFDDPKFADFQDVLLEELFSNPKTPLNPEWKALVHWLAETDRLWSWVSVRHFSMKALLVGLDLQTGVFDDLPKVRGQIQEMLYSNLFRWGESAKKSVAALLLETGSGDRLQTALKSLGLEKVVCDVSMTDPTQRKR